MNAKASFAAVNWLQALPLPTRETVSWLQCDFVAFWLLTDFMASSDQLSFGDAALKLWQLPPTIVFRSFRSRGRRGT